MRVTVHSERAAGGNPVTLSFGIDQTFCYWSIMLITTAAILNKIHSLSRWKY